MCEFYESRQSCRVSDAALPTQTSVPRTPAINCAIQSPQTSSMQLSSPIFLLFFFPCKNKLGLTAITPLLVPSWAKTQQ